MLSQVKDNTKKISKKSELKKLIKLLFSKKKKINIKFKSFDSTSLKNN